MTKQLDLRKILSALMATALVAGCAAFDNKAQNDIDDGDMEFESEKSAEAVQNGDENAPSLSAETALTDIRYVSRRGGGTVVIESTAPVTFRTRENRELNQFIVDLANAKLPDRLRRPYNTKDFGQSIASINAYQDSGSSTARVVIQFRSPTKATISQAGKRLLVFATGTVSTTQAGNESTLDDVQEIDSLAKAAALEGGPGDTRILPTTSEGSDPTKFYGKPISIEVREMNVRDVINLISEQSGANIVIASGIDGNLTLKLKQIPWDQALMIVLKSQQLGYVRQGSVLRIAPNSSLQLEAETARKILEAQRAAEPVRVKIIPVGYAKVAELIEKVKPLLSAGRGSVVADTRTSSLIVTDTPEVLDRAGNLIKALDTPPLQVMIEGKVVEAKESFKRDYGIKWGYSGAQTSFGNLTLQQNNLRINPSGNDSLPGAINGAFRLGTFDVFGDLDATLGLAESESLAKVISSPRVVVLNNEQATIDQTVALQIPQTTTTNGVTTTGFTNLNVSLNLTVTPQITTEGDVLMDVNIQRDFADASASGTVPPINKRSAKTKVMVRNGQTAVIGGIYQADTSTGEFGVPWLRNIPVVGWLFKSRSVRNDKNELMLFLTPRIINAEKSLPKEGTL